MAKHFYSYQFDMPYRATYLRNWEVPKYYCPKPQRRIGSTSIIANSRGQLLPGVPRPPCNPFGDFIDTWQMPKKITRDVANKLNGLTNKTAFMERCRQLAIASPKRPVMYSKEVQPAPEKTSDDMKTEQTAIAEPPEAPKRVICPIHDF